MPHSFISRIRIVFPSHTFTETIMHDRDLYVRDDATCNLTIMSTLNEEKQFHIDNINEIDVAHICIDGDFITYGLPDYNLDGNPDGRNDCIVFTNSTFLFVELKVEVEDITSDKGKWRNFSDALGQLHDFIAYFQSGFIDAGDSIFNHFNIVKAIVCMRFYPSFNARKNAQRNTQINNFFEKTGIEVVANNSYTV